MPTMPDATKLAAAQTRYDAACIRHRAARAAKAAQEQACRHASYRWRVERVWPSDVSLEVAASACPNAVATQFYTSEGRPCARQPLRQATMSTVQPWRVFVTLEDGRVAACACSVPPFWRDDMEHLAIEAGKVAAAHARVEVGRPRMWWQN